MSLSSDGMTSDTPPAPRRKRRLPLEWLGVTPFFLFAILFLLWPTMYLVVGAFQDPEGHFTLQNIIDLFEPGIMSATMWAHRVAP